MATSSFTATGMTCQHCVASVTKEVSELDHVTSVTVDLPTGKVTVESDAPIPADEVIAAIDKAGYSSEVSK
ncbi:heavy-metal-associated domain-containing protein [Aurantimicrobium sp. MWH-Uga1]|jgi:copper ion binding protein|uniref:heavy-metal-associated domain-containing protein n=1 Tax=Aurantimicrobium sp. MWH-Uga1 TaxID=2079575 RepID=UPI000DED71EC|nr:heavy metal-associated domain-containing protein [Aurantimicrobium sp. MWH-Uga1]AXE55152.1 Copper chaperone CopZ [Aurantimicrobium sp. MWH-Uga1]